MAYTVAPSTTTPAVSVTSTVGAIGSTGTIGGDEELLLHPARVSAAIAASTIKPRFFQMFLFFSMKPPVLFVVYLLFELFLRHIFASEIIVTINQTLKPVPDKLIYFLARGCEEKFTASKTTPIFAQNSPELFTIQSWRE
ncbi:MAG: hypothetical protein GW861_07035 [Deltaproteobacteria bacterium]|nr:hypothetical protein [Deltaproteobacteria bacterium]